MNLTCKYLKPLSNIVYDINHLKYKVSQHTSLKKYGESMKHQPKQLSHRKNNGKIENVRLDHLVSDLNNGLLPDIYHEIERLTNSKIYHFEKKGGRGLFDILAISNKGQIGIEVKGHSTMWNKDSVLPWKNCPQMYNGTYTFLNPITSLYAEYWYDKNLPILNNKFPSLPKPPPKSEWIKLDVNHTGARSEYAKELKSIKKKMGQNKFNNTIMLPLRNECEKYVKESIPLTYTEIASIIQNKMNETLEKKDIWINLLYPSPDTISPLEVVNHQVYGTIKVTNLKVTDIKVSEETKDLTIHTEYLLSDCHDLFIGNLRMRWRNGIGISNLSWNVN